VEEVGIGEAIDSQGHRFGRAAIDQEPQPFVKPLTCGGCKTGVVAVPSHTRRAPRTHLAESGQTWVVAFYRLHHRKRTPHDDDCIYDFDARTGELHRQHRSVVRKDGDIYELRLPSPQVLGYRLRADRPATERSRLDIRTRSGGSEIDPVIAAALAIVRLLRRFGDDPAAQRRFRAHFEGTTIPWRDFCFDATRDAKRLAAVVAQKPTHPIAVYAPVKATGSSQSGETYFIRLDTRTRVRDSEGALLSVFLRSTDDRLAQAPRPGEYALGFGMEWGDHLPSLGGTRHLRLWTDNPRTIARWVPVPTVSPAQSSTQGDMR